MRWLVGSSVTACSNFEMAPSTSTDTCLSASLAKLMASMAFLLQPRLAHVTSDVTTRPNRGRSFMDVSPFPRFAAPSGTYDHFWWTRGHSKNARLAEIHRKWAA